MSFWTALSALAPIAPAQAEADEIRRTRAMQDVAFRAQQAQADADLQLKQQQLRQGEKPIVIQGSQPQWNPVTHTYQQPAYFPTTGKIGQVDFEGADPEVVAQRSFEESQKAYKTLTGQDPTQEMRDAMFASAFKFKPPTGSAFKPLPASAGGTPFKGPDGRYYQAGSDPSGNVVTRPMPANFVPTEKNVPINTEYVRIMGKPPSSWTPDEQQFIKGYGAYLKAQETLAGARGAAYNASRPVQVVDPNDPNQAILMSAGEAERTGAPTTQSTSYKVNQATQSALNRYFTSGKGAENIRTLNTAVQHLDLLQNLATALGNGDIQLWNRLGQAYARQTGDAAPVNFEMLRDSLAGEMARVFTGVGATQQEIKEITDPLSTSNSPIQLAGAIQTARAAMDARLRALKIQYAQGLAGKPAFDEGTPSTPAGPVTDQQILDGLNKLKQGGG